jgi:RNA polymerase sigma-70 factor, ECF subfamily
VQRGDELDALIGRAQQGDVRAFEALVQGHLGQVRRFARAYAANETDADDLAQEALIKVYKSIRLFRYQSAFSSWLYAVVRNTFLDAARSRAGRERAKEDSLEAEHTAGLEGGARADEALLREEERKKLWHALRGVQVEFRSAVVLFDLEGLSYDEVAAIEAVPVGTIKSRLSRGREQLRRILAESGGLRRPDAAREEPADSPGTSPATSPSNAKRSGS